MEATMVRRLYIAASAVALILFLSACSERNQVGASASSERSAGTALSSSYKQSDSLTTSRDLSATTTTPAAPVILAALRTSASPPTDTRPSALELAVRKSLAGKARAGTLNAEEQAAWTAIQRADAVRVRALVTAAVTPLVAWPVEPFDMATGRAHPQAARWAAARYAGAELANAVATQVADAMAGQIVRSPDEARAKALVAFQALDHAALLAEYERWRDAAEIVTMDGQSVHYVLASGADMKIDATGPAIATNGSPWFGGGTLSGKTVQFAMSRSTSESNVDSVDSSRDRTGGASQRTDSSAGTK